MTTARPRAAAVFTGLVVLAISGFAAGIPIAVAQSQAPQQAPAKKADKPAAEIRIGYLRAFAPELTLSLLDRPPKDLGLAGAKVGIDDNDTTGRFLRQHFVLDTVEIKPDTDPVQAFNDLVAKGDRYVVADLSARQVLAIADIARDKGVLVFNIGATDDSLREEDCRINVFHVAPTRSMLADALAQYLMWKRWSNWALVYGSHEGDRLFADALRRAAARFGGQIVAEKEFKDTGTARRTDTGVTQIQKQISTFTQGFPDYDVMLVADESEVFGGYVPYRTWMPRPVAGTAGLAASAWHPASEQWAGIQMQSRFLKSSGRHMLSRDMLAWTAVRIVGEAATRAGGTDAKTMEAYLRSDKFSVAAFKGQKLTFRSWNLQLRQPLFLGDTTSVISTSPQEGYLHQVSELDTLGVDKPETKCTLK
ncbi:ABC transporter substrate-binding protein [Mesorhizobium sp. SP-1A]|uniref:ABC transporter substrate-binding protein n=1 Tax=Mesorhizobium sp. SP-1A TaxID=3077840 RepID=UPI0028F6E388|nr:ABC transporter substrate-binding protein [Mesorhizobium sp. SP-1A]